MSRFKLLYFVIFIINLCRIYAQISDKRLCVDEECKVPISLARTLLRYSSPDSRILSFAPNVDITIYSKSAGSRADLWGGEINGKRGYVPKHLVRETKILGKPTLLVDTEFSNDTEAKQVPSQVEPDKVQEPFEVVDGTTLYLNAQDAINPTSTESPIQPTALPEAETEPSKITTPEVVPNVQPSLKEEAPLVNASTPLEGSPENNVAGVEPSIDKNQEPSPEDSTGKEETDADKNQEPQVEIQDTTNEDENEDEDDLGDDEDEDDEEESEELEAVEDEQLPETADAIVQSAEVENTIVEESPLSETLTQSTSAETVTTPNSTETIAESVSSEIVTESLSAETVQESVSVEIAKESTSAEIAKESVSAETVEGSVLSEKQSNKSEAEKTEESVKLESTASTMNLEKSEVQEQIENEGVTPQLNNIPTVAETIGTSSDKSETPYISTQEEILTVESSEIKEEGNFQSTSEEKEETKPDSKTEEVEVTTLSPEMEVPQPLDDDSYTEVTPNPADSETQEPMTLENTIPSFPPLGLFSNLNSNGSPTEKLPDDIQIPNSQNQEEIGVVNEMNVDYNLESQEEDLIIEQSEEEVSSSVEETNPETNEKQEEIIEDATEESTDSGFFSGFISMFGGWSGENIDKVEEKELTPDHVAELEEEHVAGDDIVSKESTGQFCDATSCQEDQADESAGGSSMDSVNFNSDVFLYLVTTAVSVIIFLFGYIAFDKSKREGPLIAKINNLEKELLIVVKENQILQEKVAGDSGYDTNDRVSSEVVENLKQDLFEITNVKNALEEQVQSLEKELENSTEVGMELNRMLSEILSSESGSDVLKANVEHLQRQLVEQQATINSVNEALAITNTENHELKLEVELSNKKVIDLQVELDKLLLNVLKIEEEKDTQQTSLENEIVTYRQKYEEINNKLRTKEEEYNIEFRQMRNHLDQSERTLQLKMKEHDILTDTMKQLKAVKTNDGPILQSLLDVTGIKAELQLLKTENQKLSEKLQQEEETKLHFEKSARAASEEAQRLREQYDEADKSKLETETKLEVLSNYFKDREAQLQKEIARHESLWVEKQGEATSTTERIKFMQEQLQNYKIQTESLKQEIISQEVELKSQISVLEKKAHENWVSARQAERKLEEAKQEAAQLRHRLTLRERAIQEDRNQQRYQSPIEQNGDIPASPLESPASPPLLYGTRDHITKSPPIPGLPPFLPPPPGVPFMPPPLHGVPPFIPPPPTMFPGDHRPPPLGRMSSPPLNSRYSPSSRGYSPYDSSPSDSEYGTSPPQRRGYSPFNSRGEDRRDYKRPPPGRSNGRNIIKDGGSSGSGNSHESLDKINRQQSKV